jgi:hypothetical protein
MHLNDRYVVPALVLWLVVIGLFIRIWGLWNYAFSPDEVQVPLVSAAGSLHQILTAFKGETNAPLTYGIIYFLMKISYYELVLRCMSLIPGAGLIIMFFFLGRTVSGTVSGLAMAYMATFSSGAIVISQLIRQYSVHLFFLTVTLWFFILYFGKREKRYLYGYSLFMALSISTLYATVIPLSAIIIVWLGHSVIQKKPAREFANIIIFNLPPFIIFGIFYIYHISTWTGEERFQSLISQKYYGVLFPQTLSGFIENTCGLFRYLFFLSPYSTLLMVLAGAGLVLLWRSFRRSLAVIIFITFLINCALAYFKKYPLGESRHSIYLFPMVAVLGGAAIQSGLNYFTKNVIPFLAKILSLRSEYLQIPLLYLGITGILVSTLVITFSYRQSDFLRRYAYDALGNEFPQKRVNHQRVFNYLTEHVKPNDFILTNFRTSYYFRYDLLPNQPHYIFESWYSSKMKWRGFDCLYIHTYGFDKINTVIGPLEGLHKHGDLKNVSKVWLVNIEWVGDEIEIHLSHYPQYRLLFHKELSVEGGHIYSVTMEDIRQISFDSSRVVSKTSAGFVNIVEPERVSKDSLVYMGGWAYDPHKMVPAKDVVIVVDGRQLSIPPQMELQRVDVAKAYKNEKLTTTGWLVQFKASIIGKGTHKLEIYALVSDGTFIPLLYKGKTACVVEVVD